ncbi:MAG TPA: hypothetical protein VL357_00605 [Rariglobus sp.]|jgi:hypothetical protein|nr:hypothetical protein [Rariglobus sp.]
MMLNKVFDNILDIPGVDGVCLFNTVGKVLINRMPSFMSPDIFEDGLRRITALYDTMDENFLPCDDYLLRFEEKWVLFRRADQVVLLVLAADKANFMSTRMVTNMAFKHITPALLEELTLAAGGNPAPAAAAPAPAATSASAPPFPVVIPANDAAPAAAPAAPAAADAAKAPLRMFRGRAY